MRLLLTLIITGALAWPAFAVQPDERLADPALEERARDLSAQLRCVVCPNQDIDSSNAPLARDLRLLVRERLVEGDSDQEVLDFLVARYGDFVLLSPPVQANTLILWGAPIIVFLLAGIGAAVYLRSRSKAAPVATAAAPLSAEEEAALAAHLRNDPDPRP